MSSTFDQTLADDWDRSFNEFKQTVTRRIGGSPDQTEAVEAIVELDSDTGLVESERGDYFDFSGRMELAAGQANSTNDTWVIGGEVYHQMGEAQGKDGGSQTIQIMRRKMATAREPRVNRR